MNGVFFDTSVLVAGTIDLGASSRDAMEVLDAVADGRIADPSTSWHNCLEYFSVTTRLPEEYRLASDVALRFLTEEIFVRFEVHQLAEEGRGVLLRSAVARGATGGRVYDVHIAAIAAQAGASVVVTENRRHFLSLMERGIRVLGAEELRAEL